MKLPQTTSLPKQIKAQHNLTKRGITLYNRLKITFTYRKQLVSLLVLLVFYTQAQAQNQAHVYRDSIFMQVKGYTQKSKALDSIKQVYTAEIQKEQIKVQEKYLALAKPYQVKENEALEQLKARMNAQDAEKLSLLQEEIKFLETRIKSYNKQLDDQYKVEIQPFINKINAAIATYATKNKIDYVWIMEDQMTKLAYINKKNNITRAIINLLNK